MPRYGVVARAFHWMTVAGVVVMIPVGIAMTSGAFPSLEDPLFILHKGLGSLLLVLVVGRLGWRLIRRPPPFPSTMPPVERRMASATHWGLYALLLIQTFSGYIRTVGDGFPIELLDLLGIPPLIPEMPDLAGVMLAVHTFSAYALTALIAGHVGAAMYHHVIRGDGVLSRMWPPA